MASAHLFSPAILRQLNPPELVSHFRSKTASLPDAAHFLEATSYLLTLIHNGDIPSEIFAYWLPLVQRRFPYLIKTALLDRQSQGVCDAGLAAFQRALKRKNWKEQAWDAVGGVDGLCVLFETLSVKQTKHLAGILGKRMRNKGLEGQQHMDRLAQVLLYNNCSADGEQLLTSHIDTQTTLRRRPMFSCVVPLLEACSVSFLVKLLSQPLHLSVPLRTLLSVLERTHIDLLRKIVVGSLTVDLQVRSAALLKLPQPLLYSEDHYDPQLISPETLPSPSPGFLAFGFDLVEAWRRSSIPNDMLSPSKLLNMVVNPVVKRAKKCTTSFDGILKLLKFAFETVKVAEGTYIIPDSLKAYLAEVISYWASAFLSSTGKTSRDLLHPSAPRAEHREELEKLVSNCAKAFIEVKLTGVYWPFPEELFDIREVHASARLPLIKLLCRNLFDLDLDIDGPISSLMPQMRHSSWDAKLFGTLPVKDAKWLFDKLEMLGLHDCINYGRVHHIGDLAPQEGPIWYLKGLLYVKWEADDGAPTDYPKTRKLLDAVKELAETEQDGDQWGNWARRAVDIVIVSRSIRLVRDVVQWSRRFLRDPVIGPFIGTKLCDYPIARILACTSFPQAHRPISGSTLSDLVQEANEVLQFHLQTSLLAIREPSFFKSHWRLLPLSLLRSVIELRFNGIKRYRQLGAQTETELATILIDTTLPLVLEYERIGISEGYENLGWNTLFGPLHLLFCEGTSCYLSPSFRFSLEFLDRLARDRDEMWAQERTKRNPLAASLGGGFPKGLPIQYLFPSEKLAVAAAVHPASAPYFTSRLQDILFCDPKLVTEEVTGDTDVIGPFVDDLRYAISVYVAHLSSEERTKRLLRVWDHYTKVIPPTAGHVEDLRGLLLDIQDDKNVKGVLQELQPTPLLPSSFPAFEGNPVEWDPWPQSDQMNRDFTEASNQSNKLTILRCRFKINQHGYDNNPFAQPFCPPEQWTEPPKLNKVDIWRPDVDVRNLPLPDRDRLIMCAILFLDSFAGTNRRLFSTVFPPGSSEPRYPALYLDYDFLSSVWSEIPHTVAPRGSRVPSMYSSSRSSPSDIAVDLLKKLKDTIPPGALYQLASGLLQSLINLPALSPKYPALTQATFETLALLGRSDRPQLAVELGLKVLETMPDASSWHRHVMSSGVANRLDYDSAQTMMKDFGKVLLRSLEQRQSNTSTIKADDGGIAKPVKVTTLKMLPQLIRETPSASIGTILEVLSSLIPKSRHIDVRYEILDTLFSLFQLYGEVGTQIASAEIYKTIALFVLEVTGPSERVIVSEAEWKKSEEGGPLPQVHADRPLQQLLFESIDRLPLQTREGYAREVILRILDESAKQHNRWMRILLTRFELSADQLYLMDFGPFWYESVDFALRKCCAYLPKDYLARHRKWALQYQSYGILQHINEKLIAQNPEWDELDPARQHWLRFLDAHRGVNLLSSIHGLFEKYAGSKVADGIEPRDLEEEYFARMQILLREPADMRSQPPRMYISHFDSYFSRLASGKNKKARPLLERIVRDTESLRTPTWSNDPSRMPQIIPPRMQLQAALLQLPDGQKDLENAERFTTFLGDLIPLLEECAQSPSCLTDFGYLEQKVLTIPQSASIPCALAIAERVASLHNTLHGCLGVQLALKLLEKNNKALMQGNKNVRALLDSWKKSPVEWVRRIAWEKSIYSQWK
ncbi:hypothetical protein VTO42DRAFT_2545 [Malbranchea cinnamomea]